MIKLAGKSGTAIYVNPDKIIGINAYGMNLEEGSFINYGNDQYIVYQSPEEVVRKIMEYKLAMVRYKSASDVFESAEMGSEKIGEAAEGKSDAKNILKHLAGLEESPDA